MSEGGIDTLRGVQVVDALNSASRDSRVAGVLVFTGGHQAFQGLAHVEELRNAITNFRLNSFDDILPLLHTSV